MFLVLLRRCQLWYLTHATKLVVVKVTVVRSSSCDLTHE